MSARTLRTEVAIIGAGPAGLLLARLLRLSGIDCTVLESRSREQVEQRVRAGVLEPGTVRALVEAGVGERLLREALRQSGVLLRFQDQTHRLDFGHLGNGEQLTVYGQQEILKDLIGALLQDEVPLHFETSVTGLAALESDQPELMCSGDLRVECRLVAGCDGHRGVSRAALPAGLRRDFQRQYPFCWLAILAEVAPQTRELTYCYHPDGFCIHNARSPQLTRFHLQCPPEAEWSDEEIWARLSLRLGPLRSGPILNRSKTHLRAHVGEPMSYGRLFLAGDAAHLMPPTGAKGLNLAVADVTLLARAMVRFLRAKSEEGLLSYSDAALRRVWQAQRFSAWMTWLLHPTADAFEQRLQLAELERVTTSHTAAAQLVAGLLGLAEAETRSSPAGR